MKEKRLTRSHDRMVAGVAAGLAEYFRSDEDVSESESESVRLALSDPTLIRLLFVIFTLLGGPGLVVYLILWIIMPE